MKNLNNLKDEIRSTINNLGNSTTRATYENGHGYTRYLNRNFNFMRVNRGLLDLTKYNNHINYREKEKHFYLSDQLVQALKDIAKDNGLTQTTHVGLIDLLSKSIFNRALKDGSSSVNEIKEKFNL